VFYRYKLHGADGSDAGEAHYAFLVKPGETIITGAGRKLRVLDVVSVEEEDSPYAGLLMVEAVA
jgi:hypothetical protein